MSGNQTHQDRHNMIQREHEIGNDTLPYS